MNLIFFKLLYLIVLGTVIYWEHKIFTPRWEKFEYARRAMGILTVMGLGFMLVLFDVFESSLDTWLWLFFGFGLCGAVIMTMDIDSAAIHNKNLISNLRNEINKIGQDEVSE